MQTLQGKRRTTCERRQAAHTSLSLIPVYVLVLGEGRDDDDAAAAAPKSAVFMSSQCSRDMPSSSNLDHFPILCSDDHCLPAPSLPCLALSGTSVSLHITLSEGIQQAFQVERFGIYFYFLTLPHCLFSGKDLITILT